MQTNRDRDNFKERLLDLLDEFGATLKAEAEDGVFVDFERGDADSFYFQQADKYGFDE
jgi:hypothetical protein